MAYCVSPGEYDNGEIGGMIGKENWSTRRKPAPVPLCPPQTPHAARTRTRAAAVGSRRLTAELRHGLKFTLGILFYKAHKNIFGDAENSVLRTEPQSSLVRGCIPSKRRLQWARIALGLRHKM
jgi:hypothetical protein